MQNVEGCDQDNNSDEDHDEEKGIALLKEILIKVVSGVWEILLIILKGVPHL